MHRDCHAARSPLRPVKATDVPMVAISGCYSKVYRYKHNIITWQEDACDLNNAVTEGFIARAGYGNKFPVETF